MRLYERSPNGPCYRLARDSYRSMIHRSSRDPAPRSQTSALVASLLGDLGFPATTGQPEEAGFPVRAASRGHDSQR